MNKNFTDCIFVLYYTLQAIEYSQITFSHTANTSTKFAKYFLPQINLLYGSIHQAISITFSLTFPDHFCSLERLRLPPPHVMVVNGDTYKRLVLVITHGRGWIFTEVAISSACVHVYIPKVLRCQARSTCMYMYMYRLLAREFGDVLHHSGALPGRVSGCW